MDEAITVVESLLEHKGDKDLTLPSHISFAPVPFTRDHKDSLYRFVNCVIARVTPGLLLPEFPDPIISEKELCSILGFTSVVEATKLEPYEVSMSQFLKQKCRRLSSRQEIRTLLSRVKTYILRLTSSKNPALSKAATAIFPSVQHILKKEEFFQEWRKSIISSLNVEVEKFRASILSGNEEFQVFLGKTETYLPGAELNTKETIETNRELLLNLLLVGTVKQKFPNEVIAFFNLTVDPEQVVLYRGLIYFVLSKLKDLESSDALALQRNAASALDLEAYGDVQDHEENPENKEQEARVSENSVSCEPATKAVKLAHASVNAGDGASEKDGDDKDTSEPDQKKKKTDDSTDAPVMDGPPLPAAGPARAEPAAGPPEAGYLAVVGAPPVEGVPEAETSDSAGACASLIEGAGSAAAGEGNEPDQKKKRIEESESNHQAS